MLHKANEAFEKSDEHKALFALIPKEYFKINNFKALRYLLVDGLLLVLNICAGLVILNHHWLLLMPVFIFFQGILFTSFWVLAHECGHGSFLTHRVFNHTVGYIIHSLLLVPYFSWKITHSNHHNHTNDIMNDEAHVPFAKTACNLSLNTKSKTLKLLKSRNKVMRFFLVMNQGIMAFIVLWLYLATNITGGKKYTKSHTNHFNPNCDLFKDKDKFWVWISNIGFFTVFFLMLIMSMSHLSAMLLFYWLPLLVNGFFVVSITLLHHTDLRTRYFSDNQWTFLKGNLGTVDRKMGYKNLLGIMFHHISDTHVVHHFFRSIPFYHAVKVKRYIKQYFGERHLEEHGSFFKALYVTCDNYHFIDEFEPGVWKFHLD